MSDQKIEISGPYLIKALLIIGGVIALLYFGYSLLMPLVVAAIIAILLDKPNKKIQSWKFPPWLSITLSVILLLVVVSLLIWLIGSQVNVMANDWPTIREKLTDRLNILAEWANQHLHWDYKDYFTNNEKLVQKAENFAKIFFSSVLDLLSQSFIILIYIILLLMQKKLFVGFFKKLSSNPHAMGLLLKDSAAVVSGYLLGKSKIMVLLFGIYYLGFTLGSVPYALFLALFAALFSIIPYVGNLIGGGLAVLLSYIYAGSTPALIVIGVIAAAQLLENYVLTPWIIGDEIDLNPFITVFGVILFSALWGMVGAIISLPIIGVLKVVFEYTRNMEAFAFILTKGSPDK